VTKVKYIEINWVNEPYKFVTIQEVLANKILNNTVGDVSDDTEISFKYKDKLVSHNRWVHQRGFVFDTPYLDPPGHGQ